MAVHFQNQRRKAVPLDYQGGIDRWQHGALETHIDNGTAHRFHHADRHV